MTLKFSRPDASLRLFGAFVVLGGLCLSPLLTRAQGTDPKPPVPAGYKIIEGDIQVPLGFQPGDPASKAVYTTGSLWGNGVVPYEFDSNVTAENQTHAIDAMALWEAEANINFRPRGLLDTSFVHFQNSTQNNSPVGPQPFGNTINIFNWHQPYTIAHELGHTLGFWHEQSRPDRDSYIRIETANILSGEEHNFEKQNDASFYGPYDFDSVMHYGACDFTSCASCTPTNPACRTITVLQPYHAQWQSAIGQREHFSKWDSLVMSFLYPYGSWRFLDKNYTGFIESGTFKEPYKGLDRALSETPQGGTIWIERPATYTVQRNQTLTKPLTLQAPLGDVTFAVP
ncbi:MAG TPA: M12 family metallopeptidase [Verrucomicrobiae bacterium]